MYGGLIAIGVFMVQLFLTATSLNLTAEICIIAFSVIPLLAAFVLQRRPQTTESADDDLAERSECRQQSDGTHHSNGRERRADPPAAGSG